MLRRCDRQYRRDLDASRSKEIDQKFNVPNGADEEKQRRMDSARY